jgi:hypothetical protein
MFPQINTMNIFRIAIILILFTSCNKQVQVITVKVNLLSTNREHNLKYFRIETTKAIWFLIIQDDFRVKLIDNYIKNKYYLFEIYVKDINYDGIKDFVTLDFDNNVYLTYYLSEQDATFIKINSEHDKLLKLKNQPYYYNVKGELYGYFTDYFWSDLLYLNNENDFSTLYTVKLDSCCYETDSIHVYIYEKDTIKQFVSFKKNEIYNIKDDENELQYFWNYFIRNHKTSNQAFE